MADDKIALSIEIEADRAQMSLGELEEGFDGLQKKLKKQERVTDEGKAAFKRLSTEMAQTSAEIKNLELGFEGLDQDQIASEFGGLAGGIGDVTASLVLMGGENETIEQMGKSIETAMAISMGFKGAIEGASAGMKLYNNMIKTGKLQTILYSAAAKAAAIATKALNLIMKANPIGLVVAGVTAAVVAYKSFSKESKEASFAQTAFTDASNKAQIATVTQKIELNKLIKVAKDDTLSKRQRQAAIEDLNKLAPDYLGNITLETINTKEATAAIGAYVAGLERKARAAALQNELVRIETELIENNRTVREATDADYLASGIAEVKIEFLDEQKQAILDLMDAENTETDAYVGNSAKKAEADKAAADLDKIRAKEKADRLDAQKQRDIDEAADRVKWDADAKKKWDAGAADRAMAASKESQAKKDALMEDIEIAEVDRTLQTEELDRDTIHIEGLLSNQEILRDVKAKYAAEELERIEEERQARLLANQKGLESATQVIGALSALNKAATDTALLNAAGDEEKKEKIRKASFEREKKLNVAMALINGAQAVLAGFAQGGLPMAIVAGVTAAAQLAAILATTYQGGGSVKEVSDSTVPSPDGAGAGGAGAQINPVTNTSTILGNQQVYVTETDITSTQNNVSVIEESATF